MNTQEALKKLNVKTIQSSEQKKSDIIQKSFTDLEGKERILNVQKGQVVDSFSYDKDFKIEKTGKEIKEALKKVQAEQQLVKTQCNTRINEILGKVTYPPVDEYGDDWVFHGIKSKIGFIPKRYDWERFQEQKEMVSEGYISLVQPTIKVDEKQKSFTIPSDEKDLCREYNNKAQEYITASVEIVRLDTIINNLQDNKKYPLKVDQASMLGF